MRILWHSGSPRTASGYGQQTAIFTPRLRDLGHDMAISAFWGLGGHVGDYKGIPVYPSDQRYGNVMLPAWAQDHKAELVIALVDAWVLDPNVMRPLPLAVWTPVDHQPCPPKVAGVLKQSGARPIAMSKFGERMLQDEGLDPLYVPHGIPTDVFKPLDREANRKAAGVNDNFVVGIVANNSGGMPPAGGPPRKAFPQSLMAFSAFYRKHPDAKLYLHTELTGRPGIDNGLNIARLLERFEIPTDAVGFTPQVLMEAGMPPKDLANCYSVFDVLLNPSYGEGFGIPIIESLACGTPVIVSDWTSMPELCGAGWLVEGEPWYDTAHEAFFLCPMVGSILGALEEAYDQAAGLREQAVAFAQAYDADLVTDTYWVPALAALERGREVPPLPSRAERRRAKKKAGVTA